MKIMLLSIVLLSLHHTVEAEMSSRETKLIDTYFNTLSPKEPPLFLCTDSHAFAYRLPKPLQCPLLELKTKSKIVSITIWYTAVSKQKIEAHHCFSTITKERKSYFFGGSYSESTSEEQAPVSSEECRLMIRRQMSPTNIALQRVSDGVLSTLLKPSTSYIWPKTVEDEVQNWFIVNLELSGNNMDQTIISPVPTKVRCGIHENFCPTTDFGTIVWDGSTYNPCRLTRGETSNCLFSDDSRISCPDLHIAITSLSTAMVCEINLGLSRQGVLWTQDTLNDVNEYVATTDQVDLLTKKASALRKRRSIEPFSKHPVEQSLVELPEFVEEDEQVPVEFFKEPEPKSTSSTTTEEPRKSVDELPDFVEEEELVEKITPNPKKVTVTPLSTNPDSEQIPVIKETPTVNHTESRDREDFATDLITETSSEELNRRAWEASKSKKGRRTFIAIHPDPEPSKFTADQEATTFSPKPINQEPRITTPKPLPWWFHTSSTTTESYKGTPPAGMDLHEFYRLTASNPTPTKRTLEPWTTETPTIRSITPTRRTTTPRPIPTKAPQTYSKPALVPPTKLPQSTAAPTRYYEGQQHAPLLVSDDKPNSEEIEILRPPGKEARLLPIELPPQSVTNTLELEAGIRVMTDSQVNSKLQYLFQVVKENLAYAIQLIHSNTCENQRMVLNLLKVLAESSPGLIVHALLNDGRYAATLSGDVIMISKCTEIRQYQFIMRNDSFCTAEYPVRYIHRNEHFSGFVRGISKEIVDEPTIVECPNKPFYFDIGDEAIQLNNRSVISNLPVLQLPNENKETKHIPDIAFSSKGHIGVKNTGDSNLLSLIKLAHNPNRIDYILKETIKGNILTQQQEKVSRSLRKLTLDPIMDVLIKVGSVLLSIAVAVVLVKLCFMYRVALLAGFCWLRTRRNRNPTTIVAPETTYTELLPMASSSNGKKSGPKTNTNPSLPTERVLLMEPEASAPPPLYPDLQLPAYEGTAQEFNTLPGPSRTTHTEIAMFRERNPLPRAHSIGHVQYLEPRHPYYPNLPQYQLDFIHAQQRAQEDARQNPPWTSPYYGLNRS